MSDLDGTSYGSVHEISLCLCLSRAVCCFQCVCCFSSSFFLGAFEFFFSNALSIDRNLTTKQKHLCPPPPCCFLPSYPLLFLPHTKNSTHTTTHTPDLSDHSDLLMQVGGGASKPTKKKVAASASKKLTNAPKRFKR